jgi:hypothetical protein
VLDIGWLVQSLWMVSGMEGSASEETLDSVVSSIQRTSYRSVCKQWFSRAPSAYILFRALKHRVGSHKYNFGRCCATLEASINEESKCGVKGRRLQKSQGGGRGRSTTILKMKVEVKKQQECLCQNCKWLVKLILEFTTYIKIFVSLQRVSLVYYCSIFSHEINKCHKIGTLYGDTLCMHVVLYLFTLFTIHETFSHWLYPYYDNIDYSASGFSLLLKSPCAYVYRYCIIFFVFMNL